MKNPDKTAGKMCRTAIEYAKSFGIQLDYSEKSITSIEEILDYYHNDLKTANENNQGPTENQIWSMAVIWGSYIGELIKRYFPCSFKWVIEDVFGDGESLHLKDSDNAHIFPIDKVYKRLVNGKVDSIVSFYDAMKINQNGK